MRFAGSAAMASGMAGSAAADALMPNNCFVAGTPVWVLRDGVDAQAANAALAEGASWEDFAEQKPIEEVEAGDYALSRPEDDANGQLRFMPVTETYTNTTEEVVELWVVNYATGEHDHLTTTPGHPFWVDTGASAGEPGRRSLGEGGWTFAAELTAGDILRNADGEPLTVTATAHKARHEATYNFCVSGDHTYYVGGTSTWVHNASFIADSGVFADRPGAPGVREAMDKILNNPNNTLYVPESVLDEVTGPKDRFGTQAARMNSAKANLVPIVDPKLSGPIAALEGGSFGKTDLKVVLAAKERNLPVLTANARMRNQINSVPARKAAFGSVKTAVPCGGAP